MLLEINCSVFHLRAMLIYELLHICQIFNLLTVVLKSKRQSCHHKVTHPTIIITIMKCRNILTILFYFILILLFNVIGTQKVRAQ